jgi:hypothetical protein
MLATTGLVILQEIELVDEMIVNNPGEKKVP